MKCMKHVLTGAAMVSMLCLTGCQDPTKTTVNPEVETPQVEMESQEELAAKERQAQYESLFFTTKDQTIAYDGYAEYGHLITFESKEEKSDGSVVYTYKGTMNDGLGDDDGTRYFTVSYTVTSEGFVETVNNQDPHRHQESNDVLNSIIPNKVILKGELERGTMWTESFTYEGKTYEAINELIVQTTEEGAVQYRVDTRVENIPGFIEETYTETRVFEEGLGLVSFTNRQSLSQFDEEYVKDYPESEFYEFGYGRSGEIQQTQE